MTTPVEARAKPRLRGVSHRYAFFVSIPLAITVVAVAPAGIGTVGAAVYGATMILMFGASALYHGPEWPAHREPHLLELDHSAIFLFIAGTATPILLLAVDGALRAVALTLVWAIAIGGVVFEWLPVRPPRGYVTAVYLSLGWTGVVAAGDLWEHAGVACVALVVAGGLLYTAGAIVHAARRPDPWPQAFGYHEIFHLLVIAAATLHYWAIVFFVLPLEP